MFYYVRGELVLAEPGTAVIDCAGVGYKLSVSDNTLGKISNMDKKEVLLYTYMYIREDAVDLIGFAAKEELSAFKMLISVSGVGPKAAMSILSLLTVEKFALAVSTQDSKAIAKASGIGPKTAARIVLELKEKVAKEFAAVPSSMAEQDTFTEELNTSGNLAEAEKALMVLGYTKAEAQTALKGISPTASLEEMVSAALRKMALRF
ncbi:MAG: Holliday junction branch migration protein RuvA [Clostridia bacterium]|nr:Holliday junction branch migration protein RuvA [Clostridia bacterium]